MQINVNVKSFLCGIFLTAAATQPYWAQDPVSTRKALTEAGFTPVSVGSGYKDFGWLQGSFHLFSTKFEAKTKSGRHISGHYLNSPWSRKGVIGISVKTP